MRSASCAEEEEEEEEETKRKVTDWYTRIILSISSKIQEPSPLQ
jgi:hypothetical protein